MENLSFQRITAFGDAFQVPSRHHRNISFARHYRNISFAKSMGEPFSLICPEKSINSVRESVCERTPSKLSKYRILEPGMIILRKYVSIKDQVDIVNICEKWAGGFYNPRDHKTGAELRLMMMCFGRNWDPNTGYKERCRSDGSEPPPIPNELISLAKATVQDARTILKELPLMHPDVCLVKYYPTYGFLDLHQDRDESSDSLRRGLPVVSISIGETAEFVYGHTRDKKKLKKIYLDSGDVLIFGGKSRHIYHGVTQIARYTSPLSLIEETALRNGRLSLTFRQF